MKNFNKKVFKNGLTLIHEKRNSPASTVMIGTKFGSAHESIEEKGIAHFIEHLCFKGTEKRTTYEISEAIESLGGMLNAFTHEEITAYYSRLPSRHISIALEVLLDLYFNPLFLEDEIKKEAAVVCEEIKMYKDNPSAFVLEELKSCLYEPPFGSSIAGTEKNVLSFNRKKIKSVHNKMYIPSKTVVVVVGDISFESLCSLVEKIIPKGERERGVKIPINPRNEKKIFNRSGIEQTNLAVGFHLPFSSPKDSYVAEVFSTILGEGMSSRLFREIREKRGLVYAIKTSLDSGKDYSYLVIWAGTDKENADEVISLSLNEFSKMSLLSEDELEKYKKQLLGNFLVGGEDSINVATNLLMFEVRRNAEEYYQYEENLKSVSLEDIVSLSRLKKYSLVVLSPEEK